MASLNVDLNYFDHPKTMRLVARLGHGADVLPIRLWAYIGRHHPESGCLALLESEFEHICGWWGEKGDMLTAMIEIGFVKREGNLFEVNDWHEHSGHLASFKKRAKKAARKRWGIKRKQSNAPSIAKPEFKQSPSSTVHSSSLPAKPAITPPAVPAGAFELIWAKYPRRDGKKAALKHFKASVLTFKSWLDIQNALEHYKSHIAEKKIDFQYIKMGSTWFNNWEDWTSYTEGSHGANGSQGISHYAAVAKRARESLGLREPPAGGPVLAGVRDLPDVPHKAEDVDGTGKRGDVVALEILRGAGLEIKPAR